MTIEMLMTGMENPWELYWETMRPGPIAGTVPTPNGQEVHYYCDMVSMDPSGSLNQPSQCHFLLNQPTPELLNYLQNKDAEPIQKQEAVLSPKGLFISHSTLADVLNDYESQSAQR